MINEDFDQFKKAQQKHLPDYLGSGREQKTGLGDSDYNNQDDTDKAVGATGTK